MTSQVVESSYKTELLKACVDAGCLSFGKFTLKSGRVSPYFFNAGMLHKAKLVRVLANAFAHTIVSHAPVLEFDVLFGPSMKGIPLAAVTVEKLATFDEARFGDVSYAFDRPTVKTYGDGGSIVGASLQGKKVLIVDDVMTAGTAVGKSMEIISKEGGTVIGIAVILDRMEKAPSANKEDDDDGVPRPSTIQNIRKSYGIPVIAILSLDDIITNLNSIGSEDQLKDMEEYREKYRPSD